MTLLPSPSDTATPQTAVFDPMAVASRLGCSRELLLELVEIFREECPELVAGIRQAIERHDAVGLQRAAHALRGSIGNFSTGGAYQLAATLESAGRRGELHDAVDVAIALEAQVDQLLSNLNKFAAVSKDKRAAE